MCGDMQCVWTCILCEYGVHACADLHCKALCVHCKAPCVYTISLPPNTHHTTPSDLEAHRQAQLQAAEARRAQEKQAAAEQRRAAEAAAAARAAEAHRAAVEARARAAAHLASLQQQIQENQARKAQQRAQEVAEDAKLRNLAEEQRVALERIKQEKLEMLQAAGVGAGFQAKLAKLRV